MASDFWGFELSDTSNTAGSDADSPQLSKILEWP